VCLFYSLFQLQKIEFWKSEFYDSYANFMILCSMIIYESSTFKKKYIYLNLTILRVVRGSIKEPTNEIADRLINNLCQLYTCI